jgi:hypothetical protein
MMARAQGARSQLAAAFETTYGTPPISGYKQMPFASASLGAEQPLLSSELLGYGRDPLAPIKDAVTADGDVVVPIDAEAFGFWLKAAFGAPTTTGTTNKTHTFIRCTSDRVCGKVGVSRGGLHLGVAQQLANHGKPLTRRDGRRCESVAQVVNADILQTRSGADALPERLQVTE